MQSTKKTKMTTTTWMGMAAIALAMTALAAAPAAAQSFQGPVPDRHMAAVGVSFGVAIPGDDGLDTGPTLGVDGEYYLSPRISVRGQLTGAWWGITNAGDDNDVSPAALSGNLIYNWEHGVFHPYATVGLGLYSYRFTENDLDSHDTTLGINIGGGVEYFIDGRDAITGELLIHSVPGDVHSKFGTYTPWYWTVTGGFKR
jgi:hypothetical protein